MIEFRLRLSLNKSLRFEAVDSELWATCFPADSLVQCLSCFTCGSLSHFAAACLFRKKPSSSFPGRFQGTNGQQGTSGRFEPRPYQDEPGYKHASGICQNRVESTMTRALVFEVTNAPTHTTAGIVADPTLSVGVHNLVSEPICTPLRLQNLRDI